MNFPEVVNFKNHVVVARRHVRPRPRIDAGNPHAIVGIDENAVLGVGPVVAVAGPAPRLEELSVGVELDHRGRGVGALLGRSRAGPMQHPHMVAAIDGHPGRNAHHPVVREPGRPRGIHLISRNPGGAVLAQERHMPWFDRQDRRQQQRREHAVPMSHVPSDASVCKPEPGLCQRAGQRKRLTRTTKGASVPPIREADVKTPRVLAIVALGAVFLGAQGARADSSGPTTAATRATASTRRPRTSPPATPATSSWRGPGRPSTGRCPSTTCGPADSKRRRS